MFLITGFLFVRESLKSENPEIRLKGKFILIAFLFYTMGTLIDVIIDIPTEITIVLARTIMIVAIFMFYIGFTMPNWVKKRFLK